jgi:hypothetical protein
MTPEVTELAIWDVMLFCPNKYCALEGIYLVPYFVEKGMCTKRSNLLSLTLGPFRLNLDTIVTNLRDAASALNQRKNYRLTVFFVLNGCFQQTNTEI